MRALHVLCGATLALAACADPGRATLAAPCLVQTESYSRSDVGPSMHLQIIALLDTREPLPADVRARLDRVVDAMRSGDFDSDGVRDFVPPVVDFTVHEVSFDDPLPAREPVSWGEQTLVLLVSRGDTWITADRLSDSVSFATIVAIAGFPPDAVANPERVWIRSVLDDPRMARGTTEVCRTPSGDAVAPATGLATGLIDPSVDGFRRFDSYLVSICSDDWEYDVMRLARRRTGSPLGACFPRPPPTGGVRTCTLRESQSDLAPVPCALLPGRVAPDPTDPHHCIVQQVTAGPGVPPIGSGWYYDDWSLVASLECGVDQPEIRFTADAEPAPCTSVGIECVTEWGACGE